MFRTASGKQRIEIRNICSDALKIRGSLGAKSITDSLSLTCALKIHYSLPRPRPLFQFQHRSPIQIISQTAASLPYTKYQAVHQLSQRRISANFPYKHLVVTIYRSEPRRDAKSRVEDPKIQSFICLIFYKFPRIKIIAIEMNEHLQYYFFTIT